MRACYILSLAPKVNLYTTKHWENKGDTRGTYNKKALEKESAIITFKTMPTGSKYSLPFTLQDEIMMKKSVYI